MKRLLAAVLALGAVAPVPAQQIIDRFTSAQAVATAIEATPACLQWCAIGLCYWLRCTPFGCDIETTLRITHNQPDLVVTTWTSDIGAGVGGNPFEDADLLYGAATYSLGSLIYSPLSGVLLGGGNATPMDRVREKPQQGGTIPRSDMSVQSDQPEQQRHRNLRFKSSMGVGHPIATINGGLMGTFSSIPAMCPSEANPYQLYYASEADAPNWRTGFVDLLWPTCAIASYVPGLKDVGNFVDTYGNICPRTGFLIQAQDYRAGAVMAQRLVDIVTNLSEPRIYTPLEPIPGTYPIWAMPPPGPSFAFKDKWQMISPVPEPFCHPFGLEPEVLHNNTEGRYGWNYWQNYQCCIDNPGAIFIGFADVNLFCLAL